MEYLDAGRDTRRTLVRLCVAAVLAGTVAACSSIEPVSYTPIDEIPPGPGAFSGEDGVFTLYDSRRRAAEEDADEEGSEP